MKLVTICAEKNRNKTAAGSGFLYDNFVTKTSKEKHHLRMNSKEQKQFQGRPGDDDDTRQVDNGADKTSAVLKKSCSSHRRGKKRLTYHLMCTIPVACLHVNYGKRN